MQLEIHNVPQVIITMVTSERRNVERVSGWSRGEGVTLSPSSDRHRPFFSEDKRPLRAIYINTPSIPFISFNFPCMRSMYLQCLLQMAFRNGKSSSLFLSWSGRKWNCCKYTRQKWRLSFQCGDDDRGDSQLGAWHVYRESGWEINQNGLLRKN